MDDDTGNIRRHCCSRCGRTYGLEHNNHCAREASIQTSDRHANRRDRSRSPLPSREASIQTSDRHANRRGRSRSIGSNARRSIGSSARDTNATEHGYETPWLEIGRWFFTNEHLRNLANELDYMARPPLSLPEFREGILGATEHDSHVARTSRSKSHFLSTMARSIKALIRTCLLYTSPSPRD